MDPNSMMPSKEQLQMFRQCFHDDEKLREWHRKNTPWLSEQIIEQYILVYQKQRKSIDETYQVQQPIPKQDSPLQSQLSKNINDEEDKQKDEIIQQQSQDLRPRKLTEEQINVKTEDEVEKNMSDSDKENIKPCRKTPQKEEEQRAK